MTLRQMIARARGARIAAAVLLALAGSADAQGPVGVITHETNPESVSLLRRANVRHVKTTLYWDAWVADSAYRTAFTAGIARLARAPIEITVVVHSPPPGSDYATRAQVYRRYADFVGVRAAQFPAVRAWQLWNEQDAPGWTSVFGMGHVSMREQGRNYATMLGLASQRIRQANRAALVVVGGLAGHPDSARAFVQGIYDGGGVFDVMAVHAYGPPIWVAARDRGAAIRAVMTARGDTRPLWLTEFGISGDVMRTVWGETDAGTWDRRQMTEWRDVATWNDRSHVYERLIGYVLYDVKDYGFGIVRADRATVRPAYTWLQQRNR